MCVTGYGMEKEKVLGDIPVTLGTGKKIAETIFDTLKLWGISSNVVGLSFDTTSSNTGCHMGK